MPPRSKKKVAAVTEEPNPKQISPSVTAYLETSRTLATTLNDFSASIRKGGIAAPSFDASSHLLLLKRLNRSALIDLDSAEVDMASAKALADEKKLQLSNLLYEKEHLLREIQMAKELECKELQVCLPTKLRHYFVSNSIAALPPFTNHRP